QLGRPYLKRMNARLLLVRDLCVLLIISDRAAARLTPSERLQEEDDEYDRGGEEDEYYTYLSVCKNETGINLYAVYQRECDFDNQVALGRFRNAVNETGWGVFEVETSGDYDDATQAYAAGVAEGILTKELIYYHFRNTVEDMCKGYRVYCNKLYTYLAKNLEWIKETVKLKPKEDLYWKQVNLSFTQVTGIWHGYSKKSPKWYRPAVLFDITPIYMIQLYGDLFDLAKFFDKQPDPGDVANSGHCSGFAKIAPGNKDLFFSHVAMSGYNTMNRVLKLYKFGYDRKRAPGYALSFSGYPAGISSADDFVLTSAGLAALETTFAIYNKTLYTDTFIKPIGQLHCWVRSSVANTLAGDGKTWSKIFSRYNSGTYNNQWVIVDFKAFEPRKETPPKDLLWVLEQVPGYVLARDMTWFVKKYSYFPSYNIPYFTVISEMSGFAEQAKMNDWYKWGNCPRAKIFDRDHVKVTDIEQLQELMRYNDYQHEPFSRCKCVPPYSAEASISTRGDLNPANGTYEVEAMGHRNHGGLDFKGTNYTLFKKLRFRAWGGPTYDPLPVFSWNTTDIDANHYGQPVEWKFGPVETDWETEVKANLQ
uniref:Phospholipase B-like n=1 Tax=Parascaris univalens TaxID=6257 RepID=A0A915BM03_PARUN